MRSRRKRERGEGMGGRVRMMDGVGGVVMEVVRGEREACGPSKFSFLMSSFLPQHFHDICCTRCIHITYCIHDNNI